jgi:DNA invertase Pin-like site-specific DNA recombinase
MKKIAIYARVSTSTGKQDNEVQLHQLRQYVQQRELCVYKEYVDEMSGARDDRPSFQEMMNDARKRKFDAVICFRFDRFSRSTKTLIDSLEEFDRLGIDFISFSENIDTSTPMGKCMFTIIGAFASMEREVIRERVLAGLENAKAKGVELGRPKSRFDTALAIKLSQEGLGVRKIAKQVGVSYGTVHRYLKGVTQTPSAEAA